MSIAEETRREAFWHKEDKAPLRRSMICRALEECGPMTAEELTRYFGAAEKNYVRPRLTELKKTGVVVEVGVKQSPITGRNTAVWALREEKA